VRFLRHRNSGDLAEESVGCALRTILCKVQWGGPSVPAVIRGMVRSP